MIRIKIAATITTDEPADVFALHADVAAAAEDAIMFTVADTQVIVDVAGPDLPAVLAVLSPTGALGQIAVSAAEQPAQPAA
ncbi:hypothetical protein M3C36_17580 [Dietzia cinnamea]|uniref:hypothetical protein n=1 Tax=Dietzia TaxID=37914 RepID=UPI000D08D857|nr:MULTISPECIES: hypothetical protein [Dietzia]AVM66054.1 hypothetical protein C3V38_15970 [Dietzia sp. oral taxon 368]MCT1886959.1 hypothetical protein [Dietzia cinnamea]